MQISEILQATGGKLLSGHEDYDVLGFCQDTRKIHEGDMYIPLKGEKSDGHDYIDQAFCLGASSVITEKVVNFPDKNVILVEDTLQALSDMAAFLREHRDVLVVGITGSVGKTSTKDMIDAVVSKQYRSLKTLGNYNNHIGLPLTILRYCDEEVMVLEMGMNHTGEISHLTHIAKPNVAVITNVGTAHIGELGSREAILNAKMEIVEGLKDQGVLIINDDNDMLHSKRDVYPHTLCVGMNDGCELKAVNVDLRLEESYFDLVYDNQQYHVHVPVSGEHFVYNALIAIAVGLSLHIPILKCIEGVDSFELTKNRMDMIELCDHMKMIDGTYNANWDSMKSSLDVLAQYSQRKIAVLADMLELGEYEKSLHEKVGEYVVEKGIDELFCVGEASRYIVEKAQDLGMVNACHFDDNEHLIHYLDDFLEPKDIVLVKGSHGMHLSDVVNSLKEKKKMQKLLIICGGQSSEHIVSRMSCTSVLQHIHKEKYDIDVVGIDTNGQWYVLDANDRDLSKMDWLQGATTLTHIYEYVQQHDVVFPILHGQYGEDGTIQGMLEMAHVPYVGNRVFGASVSMDKIYTKKLMDTVGIPQVKSMYIKKRYDGTLVSVNNRFEESVDVVKDIQECIGFPCFIKASRSGSSMGCYRVDSADLLMERLQDASQYDSHIVVEECVDCIELETAVFGNDDPIVSRVGQILPHGEFYTFESKYEDEESSTCIPARVDDDIQEKIREYALMIYKAVDGHGLARVDFFLDRKTNKLYFNELNTMPGFTHISMYPQLMEDYGMTYSDLIDQLIALAFQR